MRIVLELEFDVFDEDVKALQRGDVPEQMIDAIDAVLPSKLDVLDVDCYRVPLPVRLRHASVKSVTP